MHAQGLLSAELDRVGEQIGKYLLELPPVRLHHRQRIPRHIRPALDDHGPDILQDLVEQSCAIRRLHLQGRAEPRMGQ